MALVNPIALSVNAFSATNNQTFYFTSNGGDQVVKNRITIRRQSDNVVVYQNTVTSFLFEQTVPSGTLVNGTYYNYYFNTYNVADDISANSNVVAFYCYSTPTITFTNLPINNKLTTSTYSFDITYNQSEGEQLNYLIYYLYDVNNVELSNSGQIYGSTIPFSTSYRFDGFKDGETYKIQVRTISVNGTQVLSDLEELVADYFVPDIYSNLTLENNCEGGYVKVSSNIVLLEGEVVNGDTRFFNYVSDEFIEWGVLYEIPVNNKISEWGVPYKLDLSNGRELLFDKGFSVPSIFTYQVWGQVLTFGLIGTIEKIGYANKLNIEYKRGLPYGETTVKDWFEIYDDVGYVLIQSNYIEPLNSNSTFTLWIKKVGDVYSVVAEDLSPSEDVIEWNTNSTVQYNMISDYFYPNEAYLQEPPITEYYDELDGLFNVNKLTNTNMYIDGLYISYDAEQTYESVMRDWYNYTILRCDFSSLSGGNLNYALSSINGLKIKRRKSDGFDWNSLYYIPITNEESFNFEYIDCLVPTMEEFDYAIVPVLNNSEEGEYIIETVSTEFIHSYICGFIDGVKKIFSFFSNVTYNQIASDKPIGTFKPIGSKYQIVVSNSSNEGNSGQFSSTIYGYNFNETRRIDRQDVIRQCSDIREFVTKSDAFILKDWDGRIRIASYTGGFTEVPDLVTGKITISFSWTDVGQYDVQSDLYENGLTDLIE